MTSFLECTWTGLHMLFHAAQKQGVGMVAQDKLLVSAVYFLPEKCQYWQSICLYTWPYQNYLYTHLFEQYHSFLFFLAKTF